MKLRLVAKYVLMRLFFWLTLRRWLPQRVRWWAFHRGIARHLEFVRMMPEPRWNIETFLTVTPDEPVQIEMQATFVDLQHFMGLIRESNDA